MPEIKGRLHAQPEAATVAEELAETNGGFGRNRLFLIENVVKLLARDAESRGNFAFAATSRLNNFL